MHPGRRFKARLVVYSSPGSAVAWRIPGNLPQGYYVLTGGKRRSDRIEIELRIQLSGVDVGGKNFTEQTRTLVVSRHGGKVVSYRNLVPQQPLTLRCYRTGVETLVNVVGPISHEGEQTCYGLGLHNADLNLWGIEFPALDEVDKAAGRVLLECQDCGRQEVAYLDTFALEVLLANLHLMRPCRQCSGRLGTVWKQASLGETQGSEPPVALQSRAIANGPRQVFIRLAAEVCLRHPQLGKEVAMTETVWCGGFRFTSQRLYDIGSVFDAALPFSQERASVFCPVRVLGIEELRTQGTIAYSVAYVRAEESIPAKRMMAQGAA